MNDAETEERDYGGMTVNETFFVTASYWLIGKRVDGQTPGSTTS